MKHPDLKIKNVVVKKTLAYQVRVESWESISPKDLLSLNVVQECLNDDGAVASSTTYTFNMTRDEIKTLCDTLLAA